jgi:DHA1 family inner membrane transport protein
MPLSLFSLALTAFAIGMTEFVVVGMLPTIALNFSISIALAGLLVTCYALAVTVAAPFVTALTLRIPRKTLMLSLIALFIAGNVIAGIAPSYEILLLGRVLSGIAHGVFFAISVKVAMQLVPKEKQASAIALMFSGLTVALVMGVPLGTFLGEYLSWRSSFFVVVFMGLLSFFAVLKWIPNNLERQISTSFRKQFLFLNHKAMLYAYALTIVSFGGPFVVYTYLSAILNEVTGFSLYTISGILVIYGLSVAVGNMLGGKLSDKYGALPTLKINIILLSSILFIFWFTQYSPLFAVLTIGVWGACAFAIVPSLQFLIMKMVSSYGIEAEEVASGTNIAAFNLGISGGSFFGSAIVSKFSITLTPLIAAIIVALSFFIYKKVSQTVECVNCIKK